MPDNQQAYANKISSFVKSMQNYFLKTNPETGRVGDTIVFPNYAIPRLVEPLIDYLEFLTNMVVNKYDAKFWTDDQIKSDIDSWVARLSDYRQETEAALERSPDALDEQFQLEVVNPLLIGFFGDDEVQKPLDLYTPLTLSHQIDVGAEARKEAREAFYLDLKNAAAALGEKAVEAASKVGKQSGLIALVVGVGAAVGLAMFLREKGKKQ